MKVLHWDKVVDKKLSKNKDCIWHRIDDKGLELDFAEMEKHFYKQSRKEKKEAKKKGNGDGDGDNKEDDEEETEFIAAMDVKITLR